MKFIDLFAGIGGFRRGLEEAGHECVGFCEWDKYATASYTAMHLITAEQERRLWLMDFKARQTEILKEEYRNGEWYIPDVRAIDYRNIPRADCLCFGAPCQDFSVAGARLGLQGDRSSLVREVFRIVGEIAPNDRPEWLIYENVKGMLSSNRGADYLAILMEMDELGYDCEWQLLNSKDFGVPQNRERVYTVGHLRTKGRKQILPITGSIAENRLQVKQIGFLPGEKDDNPQAYRVYSVDAQAPTLGTMQGGGRAPHIAKMIPAGDYPFGNQKSTIYSTDGLSRTLTATDYKQPVSVVMPAIKVKNATSTGCAQGVPAQINEDMDVASIRNDKYQCNVAVRRLTPKECFRLQGWDDEFFYRAEMVNSDTQLYKQAGNGVTVNVIRAIGERIMALEANERS